MAGAQAAQQLRKDGFTGKVVLIGAETDRPYERPPLSKGYLLGKEPRDKAFIHEAQWYGENDVELILGVTVTGLDPAGHMITVDNVDPLRYDKLLLATGSRPRQLDVPGSDSDGIRYLRTIGADAVGMSTVLECIAARWVGLEVCGVSLVTNAGAGYTGAPLTHEEVLEAGASAGPRLANVIRRFIEDLDPGT